MIDGSLQKDNIFSVSESQLLSIEFHTESKNQTTHFNQVSRTKHSIKKINTQKAVKSQLKQQELAIKRMYAYICKDKMLEKYQFFIESTLKTEEDSFIQSIVNRL